MKTIYMGLNTEPWEEKAKALRQEIIETMEKDGECKLSWSCMGRTRHMMHAHQWAEALPQYDFEIDYNYVCNVKLKK